MHVPAWGVNLNNRGSSFSLDGGRVTVFAPAKRPLHTLIPAMALRDGTPHLVFGSMGGDAQPGVHVQLLAHLVDDDADPAAAVAAPRWRVDRGAGGSAPRPASGPRSPTRCAPSATTSRTRRPTTPTWGTPTSSASRRGGYAAAADPRSEGLALGH